jgi:hypothetical protein
MAIKEIHGFQFTDFAFSIPTGYGRKRRWWKPRIGIAGTLEERAAKAAVMRELIENCSRAELCGISPNDAINQELKILGLEPSNEIHADVKDTSILLDIDETLVKKEMLADLPSYKVNSSWEILKGNFSFLEMGAENGYLGTPSLSNKQLGSLITEEAAFGLSEAVKFTLDGNELPELPMQIRMLLKMVDLDEM